MFSCAPAAEGKELLLTCSFFILFPGIEYWQAVEDEAVGDNVERVNSDADHHFPPVRYFLIQFPVESDQGCVKAV